MSDQTTLTREAVHEIAGKLLEATLKPYARFSHALATMAKEIRARANDETPHGKALYEKTAPLAVLIERTLREAGLDLDGSAKVPNLPDALKISVCGNVVTMPTRAFDPAAIARRAEHQLRTDPTPIRPRDPRSGT